MIKAKPIWINGIGKEINLCASFRTLIPKLNGQKVILSIAASSIYKAYINGSFISYGPARAAVGHFRVDVLDISKYLTYKNNIVAIEVVGYNANSYYVQNQPPFLQTEITVNGEVIKYTGESDFECRLVSERIQKTQRYSFQRPCVESYIMDEHFDDFRKNTDCIYKKENIVITEPKNLLPRNVLYPQYEVLPISEFIANGIVDTSYRPSKYIRDRSYINIGDDLIGFKLDELSVHLTDEGQNMKFQFIETIKELKDEYHFKKDSFKIFSLPINASGMIGFNVIAKEDITLYCMFDEVLKNNDVDFLRLGCANIIRYDLKPGAYDLLTFEIYTLKYMKFIVLGGSSILSNIHMVEYKHPEIKKSINLPYDNKKLNLIYDAAIETFRQNAVDLFTDCPSRERAGWLCDSFFLGRVEKLLTGNNLIEKNFLDNYLSPASFEYLPKGMLPMCYPSDHYDGRYIPNWAMWLVLELEEYFIRTGDSEMVTQFKDKVYQLIEFFKGYQNEDGLLEDLDSWIFVEWSKANDLVLNVNYPTNMLYSKMLLVAGKLYNDQNLIKNAIDLKEKIKEKSYNGEFFTDNAVRKDGRLVNTNEATEVCQYYAFFFDIAKPEDYPKLWAILVNDFGPERKENNKYPKIYFANAFIGNYLRLDILLKYGYKQKVLENIEDYFYYMAEKTGTLWEHDGDYASCNHGFASHVAVWLHQIFK